MIWNSLLVAIGGCFGAISRYGMSKWINDKMSSTFPFGTLTVNLLGSFLLGWIAGAELAPNLALLLGTGFMGAFTTFSTLKVEKLQLGLKKRWNILAIYLVVTYTLGILLAFMGFALGDME